MASNALQCLNDNAEGFIFDPKPVLYSKRILSMTGPVFFDCGGAHPEAYSENLTVDLQLSKVLELEDVYQFATMPKGLNVRTQEPFESFSRFTLARASLLRKMILQEHKSFTKGLTDDLKSDCGEVYEPVDVFQSITWYLTPQGLIVQPLLAHNASACANDFLLPYAKLRPYLAPGSPLK